MSHRVGPAWQASTDPPVRWRSRRWPLKCQFQIWPPPIAPTCHRVTQPERGYPFSLGARDAARFGQRFFDGGRKNGRQIIPASWIKESKTASSHTDRGSMGYGYLWWTLNPDVFGACAAFAGIWRPGQRHRAVKAVQIVDSAQNAKGVRTSSFVNLLQQITAELRSVG